MKYIKLFESIGLILILLSWSLEWHNNEKWNNEYENFNYFISSSQSAFVGNLIQGLINYNRVVNQAVDNSKINPNAIDSALRLSWYSATVRMLWFERVNRKSHYLDTWIDAAIKLNNKHKFNLGEDLYNLNKKIYDIRNELAKYVDDNNISLKYSHIPNKNKLSFSQSLTIESEINNLQQEVVAKINDILKAIKSKKQFWFCVYLMSFGVGSFLLIVCKLFEWRKDKKEFAQEPKAYQKPKNRRKRK
jgi:hypothetical protein